MKEYTPDYSNQEKVGSFWKDMFDQENGMGITIYPSPYYEIPTINSKVLESSFPGKTEPAKKYLNGLVSYLNDKKIIEDKFSRLPPEIQNPQREAKKSELVQKYGDLFTQNYEEKNKLRSIHTTNLCGSLQLLAMYSNQPTIKETATGTQKQILSLINGPEKNIVAQEGLSSQNIYNSYNLDQKIDTIHSIEKLVVNFLDHLVSPK